MRTTLSLDDDVLQNTRAFAQKMHAPFKAVVNEALRAGLSIIKEAGPTKPCQTKPHKMGLRPGFNLDNIQELLAQAEGEDAR